MNHMINPLFILQVTKVGRGGLGTRLAHTVLRYCEPQTAVRFTQESKIVMHEPKSSALYERSQWFKLVLYYIADNKPL